MNRWINQSFIFIYSHVFLSIAIKSTKGEGENDWFYVVRIAIDVKVISMVTVE